ncbi:DUF2878 domain-containing protein [Luteibacter aegosomaticola]|uniref:DUF2878 domain-containing protein n=1 Tax=Luteibacter aegosomaticola TaxID=2911538 RepID=UPI001FF94B55|nr:DUF2878 domain-containing protein [Luteibacter aegosomaticola]UPG92209.1 DUF2878 domain-containing protein [Luteibacter aegosomaticola]
MRWINLILYQALWFALVICASRGVPGGAIAAAVVFVAWQVATGPKPAEETRRVLAALVLGTVVDGVPALLGWWHYASPSPALPAGGAPLWILALWACFATTIDRSLRVVRGRPWLAAALGAVGGPMAYLAAAHGWQAVVFTCSPAVYLAWLGVGWALALVVLAR